MHFRAALVLAVTAAALTAAAAAAAAKMSQEVFLEGTDHELHVYRISGEEPGKTMMIIGGIQGDEPSSYITADLYADINLLKGNLIVVPRANFYSILLNRRNGQTGDMNRKFSPDPKKKRRYHLEEEVVALLKHLIAESDCLLNLHEGSGYYSPEWISSRENPMRYGQSIIYDAEEYRPPYGRRTIYLGAIAKRVIRAVNPRIKNPRYRFKPNNHDTLSENTSHKEQRESATYYALTRAHIPAFGIETSKDIPDLSTKIRLHKMVINAMMDEFGIIHDSPGITVEEPRLQYLVVRVNNQHPYALRHGDTLRLDIGDDVVVTDILANYRRGLVADVEGLGTTNDTHRPFRFSRPTRVYVRKDSLICGWITLEARDGQAVERQRAVPEELRAETLTVDVNGVKRRVANRETLAVPRDSRLTLEEIRTNAGWLDNDVIVNFKGFAPPKSVNDGNDLLFPIYPEHDLRVKYSEGRRGRRYPVVARYGDRIIGTFWIELTP